MLARRNEQVLSEHRFLVSKQGPTACMGQGRALDKRLLNQALIGEDRVGEATKTPDADSMKQVMKSVDPSSLQIPESIPTSSFMPEKAPLLDFLSESTKVMNH